MTNDLDKLREIKRRKAQADYEKACYAKLSLQCPACGQPLAFIGITPKDDEQHRIEAARGMIMLATNFISGVPMCKGCAENIHDGGETVQ